MSHEKVFSTLCRCWKQSWTGRLPCQLCLEPSLILCSWIPITAASGSWDGDKAAAAMSLWWLRMFLAAPGATQCQRCVWGHSDLAVTVRGRENQDRTMRCFHVLSCLWLSSF